MTGGAGDKEGMEREGEGGRTVDYAGRVDAREGVVRR